ncbi:MAG: hypothetical protein U5Q44_14995 [Dehalococcoidia bacterium]|nr:hypothetical protein [Dehalococcoidia bacterium]
MNGHVHGEEVDGRQCGQVAGVGVLHEGHAGVFAQDLVDLGAANVDGKDGRGAILEHAIREAPGGGAHIHAAAAVERDLPKVSSAASRS